MPTPAVPPRPRWASPFGVTSIWQLVSQRADRTPDAPLVLNEFDEVLTFGELRDQAERVAAGLYARGVRAGTVVSWQLPSRFDTMLITFALSRLDAVQNPLIMMLREAEVDFICRQARTELLIVPREFRGFDHEALANKVAAQLPAGEVLVVDDGLPDGDPATLPPAAASASPSDTRWLFYTSGTTSDPKGARHSDPGLIAASDTFCAAVQPTSEDRIAYLAPIAHVGGILHILSALDSGACLLTTAVFDPATTGPQLSRQQVTLGGSGVPFIRVYLEQQRAEPEPKHFPLSRAWLIGGSPRPASLHDEVKELLGGVGIMSGYGLTECPYLSWGAITDNDHQHAATEGRPPAVTEIVTIGDDGTPTAPNEPGELRVKAPQLTLGYVDSSLDADAFDENGYFKTGDLAVIDQDGFLQITGRIKDVIIRNMENISAREVENFLEGLPGVVDSTVIGLPDPVTGERVCVVVVPADPAHAPTLQEVAAHLRGRGLNPRKLPVQLETVPELPRNAMGKVMKRDLRERFAPAAPSTAAPSTTAPTKEPA
jgi:acyl-CoA synthetase (AMP-forming)/AMP-acid ligase II